MPLSRTEKILIAGIGVGLGALGIAAIARNRTTALISPQASTVIISVVPPYINSGQITLKENVTDQSAPPLSFNTVPKTIYPGLALRAEGLLGAKVDGYAALAVDLTAYKPAKILITGITVVSEVSTDQLQVVGDIANAAPMSFLIWDQNGVPSASFGTDWMTGKGSLFRGDVVPNPSIGQDNTPIPWNFTPSIDVSSQNSIVLEAAMNVVGDVIGVSAWVAPTVVELSITPIITISVNIQTDGGVLLTQPASVQLLNSLGQVVGTGNTSTGTISFPNLLADSFTLNVTVGSRTDSYKFAALQNTIVAFSFLHPVATFTVSPSPAFAGDTVTLNPAGTGDPQGSITQQTWLVQSGTTTILNQTLHPSDPSFLKSISYVTPSGTATETISMTVVNDAGLTAVLQQTEQVTNQTTFSVLITDDQNNRYPNIEVDLYDVSNALVARAFSDRTGTATFLVAVGTYTAKAALALYGAPGISKSVTVTLSTPIANAALIWNHPTCAFSFLSKPNVTDVGQGVIVQASVSSGETDPTIFFGVYNWGDGTSNSTTNTGNLLVTATHVYSATIDTEIALIVRNNAGLSSICIQPILVNPALIGNIIVSPKPIVGSPVTFNVVLSGGTPSYIFNQFDFGDGNKTIVGTPPPYIHTYTAPGVYTVNATVMDQVGSISLFTTVNVLPGAPSLVDFNVKQGLATSSVSVTLPNLAIGDAIVLGIVYQQPNTVSGVASSLGNKPRFVNRNNYAGGLEQWAYTVTVAGTETLTVTFNTSQAYVILTMRHFRSPVGVVVNYANNNTYGSASSPLVQVALGPNALPAGSVAVADFAINNNPTIADETGLIDSISTIPATITALAMEATNSAGDCSALVSTTTVCITQAIGGQLYCYQAGPNFGGVVVELA